jgi:hypothetical protein
MIQLPIRMPNLPSFSEPVERAAAADNLRTVASTTSEALVLLGLSFFAKAGDPVRKEISAMAVRAKSEYAPIVAVLAVIMDGIDAESVDELVQRDRDSALGDYLQGTLLHVANHESEALDAFRKAAVCPALRLYDVTTGPALFNALDALNLTGRDRLCALSWTASRWANFSALGIQPIYWALSELSVPADMTTRSEIAEILLALAGHLFGTNFRNRWFAQQAVERSLRLKAELAASENSAKMNGYAAAVHAMTSGMLSWPGIEDIEDAKTRPLELAQFLPDRIHRAFAAADSSLMNAGVLGETNLNPPESDRPAFEKAKAEATQAAQKLIEAALSDPDVILGAYLSGLPRSNRQEGKAPWADFGTPVESLMMKRPDVFRAAAENEKAMRAIWKAGQNDPSHRNIRRLMEISLGICSYTHKHDNAYPDGLAVLFEEGFLKPPLEAKSLLTGRQYIYVAAGEKRPAKVNEAASFVLVYDDEPNAYGCYPCVFDTGAGSAIRVQDLKEQLKRRGKQEL